MRTSEGRLSRIQKQATIHPILHIHVNNPQLINPRLGFRPFTTLDDPSAGSHKKKILMSVHLTKQTFGNIFVEPFICMDAAGMNGYSSLLFII
ncbi:hypothetical protein ABKN59_003816 [Abortiporus biennis]